MRDKDLLVIFTRYPRPGTVKTRLEGELGSQGAASLHTEMVQHMLAMAQVLAGRDGILFEIHFSGGSRDRMAGMFGSDLTYKEQSGNDLGERMLNSFRSAFERGFSRVILIGTDCPGITRTVILRAFRLLERHDCVFGPARDGGYYLVGMKEAVPCLFRDIPWSDSSTLSTTLASARSHGLSSALLEELSDVDMPEDLVVWEEMKQSRSLPELSVIIPALDEGAAIVRTIESLQTAWRVEVLVVDGGSCDNTVEIASGCNAFVIEGNRSRAVQMNLGAEHAKGENLLFLHADTVVPPGYDREIRETLQDPGIAAGAFSLCFDSQTLAMRIIAAGANLRSRLGMPYGDQGLFVCAATFKRMGGFPEIPILEDVVFLSRLRTAGRIVTLGSSVVTSARRYQAVGVLRTLILNQFAMAGYALDVPPAELAGLYRARNTGMGAWLAMILSGLKKRCAPFIRNILRLPLLREILARNRTPKQ